MADREVRIALVMNGGVSLAVWMAGVSHELDLIRRASAEKPPQLKPHDAETGQRWRELLRPADQPARTVVIDVIAGTSAGGLNGTMLATAIAHGGSLDPEDPAMGSSTGPWLREKWCDLGALEVGKLLPSEPETSRSLLDSEFFTSNVAGLMQTLAAAGDAASGDHPDDHSARRVTLFTPASGLGQHQFEATDAAGAVFTVPDHRFLYRFTTEHSRLYRGDGQTFIEAPGPDGFADTAALALAARASASFPAAFEPVVEKEVLDRYPPRVLPRGAPAEPSWLADGGILDNAPFGPVLDTIARAPVDVDAARYLLYVVPSAGVGQPGDEASDSRPGLLSVVRSALSFPTEADFRGDVEELESLLTEGDASWSDTQLLYERLVADHAERAQVAAAARALLPAYVRGRVAGEIWQAATVAKRTGFTLLAAPKPIGDDDVEAIMALGTSWTPEADFALQLLSSNGTDTATCPWGVIPVERMLRLVLRHLRRRLALPEVGHRESSALQLHVVSTALADVVAVRDALETSLAKSGIGPETAPATIADTLNQLYQDLRIQEAIANQLRRIITTDPFLGPKLEAALAVEVVSRCASARVPDQRSAPFTFLRLGPDAALPLVTANRGKQAIADLGDGLLYGTQISHFGAFGAAAWRRWDWMLGRMHAVAHLGALLAEPDVAQEWIRETQQAVLRSEGWSLHDFEQHLDRMRRSRCDDKGRAIGRFIDELNAQPSQQPSSQMEEICSTFLRSATRLGRAGTMVTACLARDVQPENALQRVARWFSEPSRSAFWRRMTSGQVPPDTTRAPWYARRDVSLIGPVAGLSSVGAGVALSAHPAGAIVAASAGGAVATIGVAHVALTFALHHMRGRAGDVVRAQLTERLGVPAREA